MGFAKNNFWVFLSVPHLVDNYAKIVDGRGRNLMCHCTLPSRLVFISNAMSKWIERIMHQKISQSAQINIQTDCNLVFATKCQHQSIFEPIRIKVIGNWQQQKRPISIFSFFQFLFFSCYSEKVSEKSLEASNACRLIPLNKNPGVRPISVGGVLRRIIGKCIINRIENDLRFLGGNTHICPGQKCGIEHAIQSLRSQYDRPENEPVLLVDEKKRLQLSQT